MLYSEGGPQDTRRVRQQHTRRVRQQPTCRKTKQLAATIEPSLVVNPALCPTASCAAGCLCLCCDEERRQDGRTEEEGVVAVTDSPATHTHTHTHNDDDDDHESSLALLFVNVLNQVLARFAQPPLFCRSVFNE